MIDATLLKEWLGLVALLISVGTFFWMNLTSGAKKAAAELDTFRGKDAEEKKRMMEAITKLGERTQKLETDFGHLPNKDMIHKLQNDLTETKGQVTAMAKSSEATERAIRRVEDFLLDRSAA